MLCDPWFTPAYFGSWFPFPRNDRLDPAAFSSPDYLYISHLHRDHFDPEWLASPRRQAGAGALARVRRAVPGARAARRSASSTSCGRATGRPVDLDGLSVTILAFTTPADGPLGDSLLVIDDGSARVLNQNDARPGRSRRACARSARSTRRSCSSPGAIWYPIAYDFPPELKTRLAREKRVNQMARARQYIEWVDAAHVFPCAGPPGVPRRRPVRAERLRLAIPPTSSPTRPCSSNCCATSGSTGASSSCRGRWSTWTAGECKVTHPADDAETMRPFTDKRAYLDEYRRDWAPWLAQRTRRRGRTDGATSSPSSRSGSSRCCAAHRSRRPGSRATSCSTSANPVRDVCIDFVESQVRAWKGEAEEPYVYKADVDRRLIEALLERHVEDWVNSLFLSCRFVGHRPDAANFNEFVMTFFKALSPERIAYVERCYRERREHRRRVLRTRRLAHRAVLPAPPGRPHPLRRDRRRRAHVQPAPLAVRARDRPLPHERRPPPALRTRGRLAAMSAFNHVGQCVTDLERSKRFYCELFGFTLEREINPPDESSAQLLSLTPPMAMTAAYLVRDGLVLELLHFAADGQTQPFRPRTMNEPGLTHHLAVGRRHRRGLRAGSRVRRRGVDVVEHRRRGVRARPRRPARRAPADDLPQAPRGPGLPLTDDRPGYTLDM